MPSLGLSSYVRAMVRGVTHRPTEINRGLSLLRQALSLTYCVPLCVGSR